MATIDLEFSLKLYFGFDPICPLPGNEFQVDTFRCRSWHSCFSYNSLSTHTTLLLEALIESRGNVFLENLWTTFDICTKSFDISNYGAHRCLQNFETSLLARSKSKAMIGVEARANLKSDHIFWRSKIILFVWFSICWKDLGAYRVCKKGVQCEQSMGKSTISLLGTFNNYYNIGTEENLFTCCDFQCVHNWRL